MIEQLKNHRVLVCAGTGGVGKTSISASLGVLAAREGLRTLVLTIDPAQRLAQALGIASRPGEEVAVAGVPGLSAVMIDSRREFDEFVLGSVDKGIARKLFDNRLYQQLVTNLSGSQEFTSLVRLANSTQSGKFDLVILDTPPAQNAVEFLSAPEKIYSLFEDSVIGWFSNPKDGVGARDEGFVKRTLYRGTRLVTMALERATGSTFIQELKDFFTHVYNMRNRVTKVSLDVKRLIHMDTTGFLLITGFDATKLKEALEFQYVLSHQKLRLVGVIVNRWFPEWQGVDRSWPEAWKADLDFKCLEEIHAQFTEFFSQRQEAYDHLVSQLTESVPVINLPDFNSTVQGLDDLSRVADSICEKWNASPWNVEGNMKVGVKTGGNT